MEVPMSRLAGRSDEEVMLEAQQGSHAAFAELERRFRPRMFQLAFRVLRHEDDANDAVQAALLGIYVYRATFRREATPGSWIYRITMNAALMALRSRRRHRNLVSLQSLNEDADGEEVLPSRDPGPEAVYVARRIGEQLGRAIRRLNPTRRTVFLLLESDGLSLSEISAKLGISHGAVKSRLHNARYDLRDKLRSLRA
jgi:RNA polymerase sigma-70 factor (ECF subfamily)